MKSATPLLLVSLAANVALAAFVLVRRPPASDPAPSAAQAATTADYRPTDALRSALASGDAAALEAAGFAPEVARELALGRSFARLAESLRAAREAATADPRWWRSRPGPNSGLAQEAAARRELSELMNAAFGDDFGLDGDRAALSFLSADKRSALRRITQDYDEMIAKFSAGGIQLPSDREKLQLLRAERERDIAALLTPAEFAEYEMRTSASAAAVRARYGAAIASEEDFRKLYTLQKAFDEKYPMPTGRVTPETMRARAEGTRQLQADQRAALGQEAYAALTRAADPDLRTIDTLAARLNLPADTTERVAAERDRFAAESQRVANDAALTLPQRRAQLQDLGQRAKASLAGLLGSEAADAYAQHSPWLSMLQGGVGFSTNVQDGPMGGMPGGPGVVPVMPGGPAGGGRAVMNIAVAGDSAGAVTASAPANAVFFSAGAVAPLDASHTMTFDTISVGPEIRRDPVAVPTNPNAISTPAASPPANPPAPPAPRG